MKKKSLWLVVLCMIAMLGFQTTTIQAAMADEAEDYELGEDYAGNVNYSDTRYYKFSISEKSRVTLSASVGHTYHVKMNLYNTSGKKVLNNIDLNYTTNSVTGKTSASLSRTLAKGTYYLEISSSSSANYTFSFRINAEKQIKLSRGTIKSLKSNKKGQMTVQCASATNAIGYRIQYSTDSSFKKNVKTIYSPTAKKTIKGLKKGKRYYVKVCPYTVYDDGTKVFGQNSYVKQVLVKKK